MMNKLIRVGIRAILADPVRRRDLMIEALIACQAREGIETTHAQAADAYDKIQRELRDKARTNDEVDEEG